MAKKNLSLLEKALKVKASQTGRPYRNAETTAEQLPLALAYLRGEVTGNQVAAAIGTISKHGSTVTTWAGHVLCAAYKHGMLVEKK